MTHFPISHAHGHPSAIPSQKENLLLHLLLLLILLPLLLLRILLLRLLFMLLLMCINFAAASALGILTLAFTRAM